MTKIHEDILIHDIEHQDDENEDNKEENEDEAENKEKDDPSIKKMNTYKDVLSRKKMSKSGPISMNSIDISKVNDEDMLTYIKMKKLKNLFNVCKVTYMLLIISLLRNSQKTDI